MLGITMALIRCYVLKNSTCFIRNQFCCVTSAAGEYKEYPRLIAACMDRLRYWEFFLIMPQGIRRVRQLAERGFRQGLAEAQSISIVSNRSIPSPFANASAAHRLPA